MGTRIEAVTRTADDRGRVTVSSEVANQELVVVAVPASRVERAVVEQFETDGEEGDG